MPISLAVQRRNATVGLLRDYSGCPVGRWEGRHHTLALMPAVQGALPVGASPGRRRPDAQPLGGPRSDHGPQAAQIPGGNLAGRQMVLRLRSRAARLPGPCRLAADSSVGVAIVLG